MRSIPRLGQRLILASTLALGVAACGDDDDDDVTLTDPLVVSSENGTLDVTLNAQQTEFTVAGTQVQGLTYGGSYIPPTLRLAPGETLHIALENNTGAHTNLHTHGLNVTPIGDGDNVLIHINPGDTREITIPIPDGHTPGLYWYHSHMHGVSEDQVLAGLSGGLIIEGILDPFPDLAGITEHVMLLKDLKAKDGQISTDDDATLIRTINGQQRATVEMKPGEIQLWRIGNVGANSYFKIALDGHTLYELARDAQTHTELIARDEILIPPAARVEVLVQAGVKGDYTFRALDYNTGPAGDDWPAQDLLTLKVKGDAAAPRSLPSVFPAVEDLATTQLTGQRTFEFSETDDSSAFFINGQTFDENRVDTTVKLGDVEEWTLVNTSAEQHVFHIHQTDFQVTEINGAPIPFTGRQDTVNIPEQVGDTPGTVKVIIPFTEPQIVGKFVYHCHILEHEDKGMMQQIQVTP